jgi:hypothetical protein
LLDVVVADKYLQMVSNRIAVAIEEDDIQEHLSMRDLIS